MKGRQNSVGKFRLYMRLMHEAQHKVLAPCGEREQQAQPRVGHDPRGEPQTQVGGILHGLCHLRAHGKIQIGRRLPRALVPGHVQGRNDDRDGQKNLSQPPLIAPGKTKQQNQRYAGDSEVQNDRLAEAQHDRRDQNRQHLQKRIQLLHTSLPPRIS